MIHLSFNRKDTSKPSWEQINKVDPAIKFTVKGNQENGAIPFLDTLVKPEADNNISITVYRKPTYTDQYLQWDNHHNLVATYSVISTLTHRGRTVCTKSELHNKEIHHLRKAVTKCKYPKCEIDKVARLTVTPRKNPVKKTTTTPAVTPQGGTPTRIKTVRDI